MSQVRQRRAATSKNMDPKTDTRTTPAAVDLGSGALFGPTLPSPLAVRLSFEANRGTPALASMIARVLLEAGATVTFGNNAAEMPERTSNLLGLHVHIDRLTWVRDEESERWTDRPNPSDEPRRP